MLLIIKYCTGGGSFYQENIGHNCPVNRVIADTTTCVIALQEFGLTVINLSVNRLDRPAGCYWQPGGRGFFNRKVIPSSSQQNKFGLRGGLCRNTKGNNYQNKNATDCIMMHS